MKYKFLLFMPSINFLVPSLLYAGGMGQTAKALNRLLEDLLGHQFDEGEIVVILLLVVIAACLIVRLYDFVKKTVNSKDR